MVCLPWVQRRAPAALPPSPWQSGRQRWRASACDHDGRSRRAGTRRAGAAAVHYALRPNVLVHWTGSDAWATRGNRKITWPTVKKLSPPSSRPPVVPLYDLRHLSAAASHPPCRFHRAHSPPGDLWAPLVEVTLLSRWPDEGWQRATMVRQADWLMKIQDSRGHPSPSQTSNINLKSFLFHSCSLCWYKQSTAYQPSSAYIWSHGM